LRAEPEFGYELAWVWTVLPMALVAFWSEGCDAPG
jgi:hypothetical protein